MKPCPSTRKQRCGVHKTANVLNKLPKYLEAKAKAMLHDILMTEKYADAERASDLFVESFQAKYLLRDNDGISGSGVHAYLDSCGRKEVRTGYRSPWQDPFVERYIGTS